MIWLAPAEQAAPDVFSLFANWGPLGVFAGLLVWAVRYLHNRVVNSMQATIDAERARGDRLEKQVNDQNALIQDRVIVALVKSNELAQRRERHNS